MHDINPLGTTMHLRELDRQAAPKFRSLPLRKRAGSKAPLSRTGQSGSKSPSGRLRETGCSRKLNVSSWPG